MLELEITAAVSAAFLPFVPFALFGLAFNLRTFLRDETSRWKNIYKNTILFSVLMTVLTVIIGYLKPEWGWFYIVLLVTGAPAFILHWLATDRLGLNKPLTYRHAAQNQIMATATTRGAMAGAGGWGPALVGLALCGAILFGLWPAVLIYASWKFVQRAPNIPVKQAFKIVLGKEEPPAYLLRSGGGVLAGLKSARRSGESERKSRTHPKPWRKKEG